MFIVRSGYGCGIGESVQEAIEDYELGNDDRFCPDECKVYEAKEIKVQRKFEVIKEN